MATLRTEFNEPDEYYDSNKYALASIEYVVAWILTSVILTHTDCDFVDRGSMCDYPKKVGTHAEIDNEMDVVKVGIYLQ
jgi:hypothetical protein